MKEKMDLQLKNEDKEETILENFSNNRKKIRNHLDNLSQMDERFKIEREIKEKNLIKKKLELEVYFYLIKRIKEIGDLKNISEEQIVEIKNEIIEIIKKNNLMNDFKDNHKENEIFDKKSEEYLGKIQELKDLLNEDNIQEKNILNQTDRNESKKETEKILLFRNEKIKILKESNVDCLDTFFNKSIEEKIKIIKKLGFTNNINKAKTIEDQNKDLDQLFEWAIIQYDIDVRSLVTKDTKYNKIELPTSPRIDILNLGELSDEVVKKLKDKVVWDSSIYQNLQVFKNAGIKKSVDFISKSMKEKVEICVSLGWLPEKYLKIENFKNKIWKSFNRMISLMDENFIHGVFFENFEKLSLIIEWQIPVEYFNEKEFENCKSRFEKGIWGRQVIFERKNKMNEKYEKFIGCVFDKHSLLSSFVIDIYPNNEQINYLQTERDKEKRHIFSKVLLNFNQANIDEKIKILKLLKSDQEDENTLEFLFGPQLKLDLFLYLIGDVGISIKDLKKYILNQLRDNMNKF